MLGPSNNANGLRWTAFAALLAVAVLAFLVGWILPSHAPDGGYDARGHARQERHAAMSRLLADDAVIRR